MRERLERRVARQDLFAGLVALVRASRSGGAVAAGSTVPLLGGILVMKTLITLAAAGVALATLAAGFWFLDREGSGARERRLPPEPRAPVAEIEPVLEPASASEAEGAATARLMVAVETDVPAPAAAEPTSARAPRLAARIVDERGFAIAGAAVFHEGAKLGESGPSGEARVRLTPVEQETAATLEFRHPRFARREVVVRVAPGAEIHLGDIALTAAGEIRGWVEDALGQRLGGARVVAAALENVRTDPEELRRLGPIEDGSAISVACAEDGSFRIECVPAGPARVWAGARGLAWSSAGPLEVVAGETLTGVGLVLGELRSDDRIGGVVLDPDGAPVPGARVEHQLWFVPGKLSRSEDLQADAEGRFEILLQQRVPHDFTASDPENRWSELYAFGVEPGSELVFQFLPGRWIEVLVTDTRGEPLGRFELELASIRAEWPLRMEPRYEAPQEGRTRLRVPNAPFRVAASTRGYVRALQGPFEPERSPVSLSFELEPLPGIHGRVLTSAGEPAPGARVALRRRVDDSWLIEKNGYRVLFGPEETDRTTADDAGRFTLYPDVAGEYALEAEAGGHALTVLAPRLFDRRAGVELEIQLVRGGAIEGRVIAAPGADTTGFVLAYHRGDGRIRTLRAGPEGRYRLEGLTPGPWEVKSLGWEVDEQSTSTSVRTSSHGDGSPMPPMEDWSCEVLDGRTTRHDVDVREFAPCAVEGRLVLAERGLEGWTASLERPRFLGREVIDSIPLGGDGRFRLEASRAGEYALVLRGPEESHGRLELSEDLGLAPGSRTWELLLRPGRLEGSGALSGENSERFYVYNWRRSEGGRSLTGSLRIVPDAEGCFVLPTVPEGPGMISRSDSSVEGHRLGESETAAEFELPPGGLQRVELR